MILENMRTETCFPVKVVRIFFLRPAAEPPTSSPSSSPTGSLCKRMVKKRREKKYVLPFENNFSFSSSACRKRNQVKYS